MEVKTFAIGELQVNCYLVIEKEEVLIFDPGGIEMDIVFKYIEEKKLKPKAIILTHGHLDHVAGLEVVVAKYGDIEVYIGQEEFEFLYNPSLNLSSFVGRKAFKLDKNVKVNKIKDGDIIFGFQVISTPGHTIGSKCFYKKSENILISGDTMFNNGIGRIDLPTGDHGEIFQSLKKLLALPEETIVYPGHGASTSIKKEKFNRFY